MSQCHITLSNYKVYWYLLGLGGVGQEWGVTANGSMETSVLGTFQN